jgi:hypothetical protein
MTAVQRMGGNDCLATAGRDPRLARDGKLSEYPRNLLQLCPGIPCAMFHVAVDGPLHTEAEEGAYISLSSGRRIGHVSASNSVRFLGELIASPAFLQASRESNVCNNLVEQTQGPHRRVWIGCIHDHSDPVCSFACFAAPPVGCGA